MAPESSVTSLYDRIFGICMGIVGAAILAVAPLVTFVTTGFFGAQGLVTRQNPYLHSPGVETAVMVVCCLLIAAVVIRGWGKLIFIPRPALCRTTATIVCLCSCIVAAWGQPRDLVFVAAFAIPVVLVGEMLHRNGRDLLTAQASGTYTLILLTVSCSFWVFTIRLGQGEGLIGVGAAVLAFGSLASHGLGGKYHYIVVLVLTVGIGAVVSVAVPYTQWWQGVFLGVFYTLFSWGLGHLCTHYPAQSSRSTACIAVLPHAAIGVLVYALAVILA